MFSPKPTLLTTLILFTILLGLSLPSGAFGSSVNGRYLKGSGKTVVLEISVGKPAPSSVIVEQLFNPQNKITNVSPQAKKVGGNGQVKWLVKKPRPGKQKFTINLSGPLKGSVRGVIRFKDPSTGKFVEKSVRP